MAYELMPMTFRFSGGAANTDPDLCLGGAVSSEAPLSNTVAYAGPTIAGVTLIGGNLMDGGIGQLRFTFATLSLALKAPGDSVFGPEFAATTTVDGAGDTAYMGTETWVLALDKSLSPNALLAVEIDVVSLPSVDTAVDVLIEHDPWSLFPAITDTESSVGSVKYRGLYLLNKFAAPLLLELVAHDQPTGAEFIDFAWGGSANDTLEIIPNETTPPADTVFSNPSAEAIFGTASGDIMPLWVRQRIPARNTVAVDDYRIKCFAKGWTHWAGLDFYSTVAASKAALRQSYGETGTATYSVTLAGTPDIEFVPVYFTVKKYAAKYLTKDTLSISIVAQGVDMEAVYDRRGNDLKVIQTIEFNSGNDVVTTVAGMGLSAVKLYGSGQRRTITLEGEKTATHDTPTLFVDMPVSRISGKLISGGSVTVEIPSVNAFAIEPANVVVVDGVEVVVDTVSVTVRGDEVLAVIVRDK